MNYMTVNAFYDPTHNNINLLPALAQPPFFSATMPMMLNLAGYGMVVGHEITHGFDNSGRQYNGFGKMEDWWQPAALKEFTERTKCMVNQYVCLPSTVRPQLFALNCPPVSTNTTSTGTRVTRTAGGTT